jgi:hypothetical protein
MRVHVKEEYITSEKSGSSIAYCRSRHSEIKSHTDETVCRLLLTSQDQFTDLEVSFLAYETRVRQNFILVLEVSLLKSFHQLSINHTSFVAGQTDPSEGVVTRG